MTINLWIFLGFLDLNALDNAVDMAIWFLMLLCYLDCVLKEWSLFFVFGVNIEIACKNTVLRWSVWALIHSNPFYKLDVIDFFWYFQKIWKICNLRQIRKSNFGPGWERHTVTLRHTRTCHIKNTCVVCCSPKTLYGELPHLFLIYSVSNTHNYTFCYCLH